MSRKKHSVGPKTPDLTPARAVDDGIVPLERLQPQLSLLRLEGIIEDLSLIEELFGDVTRTHGPGLDPSG
jgi:hypothetical protein